MIANIIPIINPKKKKNFWANSNVIFTDAADVDEGVNVINDTKYIDFVNDPFSPFEKNL